MNFRRQKSSESFLFYSEKNKSLGHIFCSNDFLVNLILNHIIWGLCFLRRPAKSSPAIWHYLCSKCQIDAEDFVKFCGLLRKNTNFTRIIPNFWRGCKAYFVRPFEWVGCRRCCFRGSWPHFWHVDDGAKEAIETLVASESCPIFDEAAKLIL